MSSKRRIRRKKCTGKKRYAAKEEAYAALWAIKQSDNYQYRHLQAYKCPFCKGWHLGNWKNRKHEVYKYE